MSTSHVAQLNNTTALTVDDLLRFEEAARKAITGLDYGFNGEAQKTLTEVLGLQTEPVKYGRWEEPVILLKNLPRSRSDLLGLREKFVEETIKKIDTAYCNFENRWNSALEAAFDAGIRALGSSKGLSI